MTYPEFLIVFTIFAGVATYISGRDLKNHKDDPLIAERMFRHQERLGFVYMAIIIGNPLLAEILGYIGIHIPTPDLPMFQTLAIDIGLILVCFSVDHFQRRSVLNQTWNLFEALVHTTRLVFAINGFWFIAAVAPSIVLESGSFMWEAAGGLSVLLVVWCYFYAWIASRIVSSSAIEPDIRHSLADIIEGANAPEPTIYAIHADNSGFFNAFAIPSLFSPTVMISRALFRYFDPDEIRAIFAHEIAHLEEYPKKRLLVLSLIEYGLVVFGCLCVPALKFFDVPAIDYVPLLWIVIVIFCFSLKVRKQQKSEHYSDIRAAELSGNVDATINALTKVHTFNFSPRRTDMEFEANSTHPSLAKRIRAIRQHFKLDEKHDDADGTPKKTLVINLEKEIDGYNRVLIGETRLTLLFMEDRADSDAGVFLADNPEQIDAMLDGAAKQSRIAYSRVAELRVEIKGKKYALRIIEKDGDKIDIPVRHEDLELIQKTLDTVDDQIPQLAKPMPAGLQVSGLLSFVCGFALIMFQDWGYRLEGSLVLLVFCALNFWKRTPARMAGVAGACFGFVLHGVSVFLPDGSAMGRIWAFWALIGLIGGLHLYFAWQQAGRLAGATGQSRPEKAGMILLACCLVLLIPHTIGPVSISDSMSLYSAANTMRWLSILLLSAGCILIISENRWFRPAGWFAIVLALIPPVAGSEWFLCEYTGDCWAKRQPKPIFEHTSFTPRWEIDMNDYFRNFSVSPNGKYLLFEDEEYRGMRNYVLYMPDGKSRKYEADLTAFADDGHLLTLEKSSENGYDLAYKALPDLNTKWQTNLSGLTVVYDATLTANQERWRIVSRDEFGTPKRWSGVMFENEFKLTPWKRNRRDSYNPMDVGEGDYALSCSTKGNQGGRPFHWYLYYMNIYYKTMVYQHKTYRFKGPEKRPEIGVSAMYTTAHCPPPGYPEILVCANSEARTYLWLVNTETTARRFVGTCALSSAIAWNGECIALAAGQSLLLMNPHSKRNYRIGLPFKPDYPSVAIGRTVAAIAADGLEGEEGKTFVWVLGIPGCITKN